MVHEYGRRVAGGVAALDRPTSLTEFLARFVVPGEQDAARAVEAAFAALHGHAVPLTELFSPGPGENGPPDAEPRLGVRSSPVPLLTADATSPPVRWSVIAYHGT
ncbi:hypothetical protein [Sphaerisporangium aureirubrum]|uniref:Condensation domain-containing protein n=1 Tax=Sphaerisporangium aureirubrum TaxID=1544736 RepID=A0ABW1NQM3_9ACTN